MAITALNKNSFETEVLGSDKPVLVDFWAEWCGPCRMLAPVVDQIAGEYEGRLKVCKVNIDEEPQLAAKYGVMSIPTLMLFKDGQATDSCVGVRPKKAIESMLSL